MHVSGDEERELAWEIRESEENARAAIAGITAADLVLRRRPLRAERTRAGALDRLEEAVVAVAREAKTDPSLLPQSRAAGEAWQRAESLRWRLAMSARHVATGEARKLACSLMSEEDLVQEGCIGLLRAARRFDPDRGIRFTTYARWWVRAQMTRAIETSGRLVRLPGGAVEQLRNLRIAGDRMEKSGEDVDTKSLAREVGIERSRAEQLLSLGGVLSMDQSDDDGLRIGERIAVEGEDADPDGQVQFEESMEKVREAFGDLLDERERFILVHHYGLDGIEAQTMADIGKAMGLSRERVRQIEASALARLRKAV